MNKTDKKLKTLKQKKEKLKKDIASGKVALFHARKSKDGFNQLQKLNKRIHKASTRRVRRR